MPHNLLRLLVLPAAALGLAAACTRPDAAAPPVDATSAAPAAAPAAQPASTTPPDCAHPFGLYPETELTYQLTNEKRQPEGIQILKVATIGEKPAEKKAPAFTQVLLKSTLYDNNNRLQRNDEYQYLCRNDTVLTDGRLLLDPGMLRSFRDRRFAFEPVPLAWPNQPTAGALPGGSLTVQVSSPSVDIAKVMTTVTNRRVSGPENVTVPAGTFSCYKVESRYEYVTQARPDLIRRTVKQVVDYYAPNLGIVRTEMRDPDGELDHTAELIKRAPGRR
ncbi:TapB family protein [Hymenobacter latericus]|uniref:TapB family protein n=1 Tax=Hymenobacter sp. YIM 151858-1 TaxID=2987688 RepID=UPI0022276F2A|nr:hypothetical protein [Hymenobacter sp. YIM 151858-1]UYZ60351.1 hypothetical protein OIS50_06010 [Hymenobacter sp. YIM 151858-1]